MSKTMSKKDQKAIQKAEEIIAEVEQNGLKGGALIVLRATDEDGNTTLDRMITGRAVPTIAALEIALVEVCKASGIPLTRIIGSLLKDC